MYFGSLGTDSKPHLRIVPMVFLTRVNAYHFGISLLKAGILSMASLMP